MATVWTFGDSLTAGFSPKYEWSRDYIEWKGYVPKVYGNFVSEIINYDLQNMGKVGSDNYTIFETFCKTYPKIKDDDIIIIGWSSPGRFRIVTEDNEWRPIIPNFSNYLKNLGIVSEQTIKEILVNRINRKYAEEVNNWISFIDSACINKKIVHWSTVKGGDDSLDTFHFFEMERINTETNGLINDYHFSENGQQHLAAEIIDVLMGKKKMVKSNKLI
jgi:hypothetical protein